MSGNGEDIIRETFEKLGDAIGVQMQIPDAMITNLAARLQAQIDLLAELQSTGRLLADDEMRLTAEQVEDVRALVWLDGRRNFDAFYRLRALFPATEPAEDGWGDVNPNDPQGRTYRETAEEYYSAPAEPAEEETKAGPWMVTTTYRAAGPTETSDDKSRIDRFAEAWRASGYEVTVARVAEADELLTKLFDNGEGPEYDPTSSPVVPAPTETEAGHA